MLPQAVSRNNVLGFILFFILLWSMWHPHDWFTWWLEAAPVFVGLAVLAGTYRKFRFSHFTYFFIFLHMVVLLVGAHYTYARVPLFDWLRDIFEFQRNHYDRVGHFMQGFVPALITREILLRREIVRSDGWRNFLTVCVCLAISAFYELVEWWVAVATGTASNDFIGSQGDVWDTQSDMLMALIGASCAVWLFRKWQDRSIAKLYHSF